MFGNDSKPSRIYSYKARCPIDGSDAASEQILMAHRYRNKLVELEQERRRKVEEAIRVFAPDLVGLDAEVQRIDTLLVEKLTAMKAANQRERRRSSTPDDRRETALLRGQLRDARGVLKERRKEVFGDASLKATLESIDADSLALQKEARSKSELYWGTYLLIEAGASKFRKGAPPRFKRWTGDGSLAVQIQGGLDWSDALACSDSRIRIQILPIGPDASPDSRRSLEKSHAVVWFRAGSIGPAGRLPLWVRVPFRLHRMPPEGSRIKWAYLHRFRIGTSFKWEIQFVLERESWEHDDQAIAGRAGVDINWRVVEGGIRVATACGEDGSSHTLIVPRDWIGAFTKAKSLQSIRDRNFDEIRVVLSAWLKTSEGKVPIPDWLKERTAYLAQWKDIVRLCMVVKHWRENRFDGDGIFETLEAWRKQDNHLHDWQDNQLRKAIRRRDDLYRKFSRMLARTYREVFVENTNWKDIKARPEADEEGNEAARVYAQVAAPGRLSQYIREVVSVTHKVPAENTTKTCHVCGIVDDFDSAKELVHRCSGCGKIWDQDVNAAINLLNAVGACQGA
jgi:hypothetical protein